MFNRKIDHLKIHMQKYLTFFIYSVRLPGLTAGSSPFLHSGHSRGSYFTTSTDTREYFGTPNSTFPLLRSTKNPTPITLALASRHNCTTSLIEPPVVTTSSTTSTFSSRLISKPRRKLITPFSRSEKTHRAFNVRATSWPTMMPPTAGAATA